MAKYSGPLIALGEGIYTVRQVARILRPQGATVNKIKYWLNKGLLGEPIRWGSRGKPHLLSFEQLLKVRTIQQLRNSGFPLQRITPAIRKLSSYVFDHLFGEEWYELTFFHSGKSGVGVMDSRGAAIEVETGQWIMPEALEELSEFLRKTREDWVRREVDIVGFPRLASNARILGGAPIIRGTRIETSFVAYMVDSLGADDVLELYPRLDEEALEQAADFEDVQPLAA